jgi:hypothetical protein
MTFFSRWLCVLASLTVVSACNPDGQPLGPHREAPTIRIMQNRGAQVPLIPRALVSRRPDRSLVIQSNGHSLEIRGAVGIVDGKHRIRFSKESAELIDLGIREMEASASAESERLLAAAERCTRKSASASARSTPAAMLMSGTATTTDTCTDMGLAYWNVSQQINTFWDSFWSELAYDIFKDVAIALITLSPEVAPVVIIADVGTAYVEYQFLQIERGAIAGAMKANNCV